jgi:hypothetical protein
VDGHEVEIATGFHFALVAMSRTRMPWWHQLADVVGVLGNVPAALDLLAADNSGTPPCFTPFGSPWTTIRMVTCNSLSSRAEKSTCRPRA